MSTIVYSAAIWIIPLVIAIVFHEVAHGWVASALGDPTARRMNRLSLNPVRHVDPAGTILVPLSLAIANLPVFGWAKPVPVVASQLRNPRRDMMIVAVAGPATNLVLAMIGTLALAAFTRLLPAAPPSWGIQFLFDNLFNFVLINVFLALFNLLPIPPFDGGHVVEGLLPRALARQYGQLARYAFPVMLLLLVVLPTILPAANVVEWVIGPPAEALVRLLLGIAGIQA